MSVIYDISVLGANYNIPRAKTGIYRAIENLAQELVKARGIGAFSATLRFASYPECYAYLRSSPGLNSVPLLEPNIGDTALSVIQYSQKWRHSGTPASLPMRGLSRLIFNRLSSKVWSRLSDPVRSDYLAESRVFHSPFYPIPDQIKQCRTIKKVITVYDLIPLLYPEYFKFDESGLISRVLASIDENTWVTCISESTRNDLCNYLPAIDPAKVFVTPLAASATFYPCQDRAELDRVRKKYDIPDGPYVLSLSTLEPRKNIAQTIRSFFRLVEEEKIADLSLVLVGPKGWNFDAIFNEIASSPKMRDRVIVTGYAPDEDLAPLYSGAMMFVYPSFYEGFGLPPLEAMQCGVPVITSNTSSLPEVVGDAGIYVSPNDGLALSQAMLDIYQSDILRRQMSADSLDQAIKFSWKRCADQTIDVYKIAKSA